MLCNAMFMDSNARGECRNVCSKLYPFLQPVCAAAKRDGQNGSDGYVVMNGVFLVAW
jgi:hypothetical protein